MDHYKIVIIIAWLCVGWLFTIWFVHRFLDDRRWADTGKEVGPGTMLLLNLFGPAMLVIMLVFWMLDFLLNSTGDIIRRIYRVPR